MSSSIVLRPARLPEDSAGIAAIDKSFTTEAILDIAVGARDIRLIPTPIPLREKRFAVYDLNREDRDWDEAHVACEDGRIIGFAASSYQFWNRRVVLWHLYVDTPWRGQGLGARLLGEVFARAARQNALCVWLETSNLNVPGVSFYEKRGFVLGGVDTTLYGGAQDSREKALYLVKFLDGVQP